VTEKLPSSSRHHLWNALAPRPRAPGATAARLTPLPQSKASAATAQAAAAAAAAQRRRQWWSWAELVSLRPGEYKCDEALKS